MYSARLPNRKSVLIAVLLLLSGCGVLTAPNVPATLRVESTAYILEATAIAASLTTREVQVALTALAAQTEVAQNSSINRVLMATARAVIPPTPPREVGVAPEGAGMMDEAMVESGQSESAPAADSSLAGQFVSTGVTTAKRDSDGCAVSFQTQFTADIYEIYVITRAVSLRAGTVMGAQWSYNGEVVAQNSWTAPQDETNFCIWFFINADTVPLSPGEWTVRLTADGRGIDPLVPFTILDSGA